MQVFQPHYIRHRRAFNGFLKPYCECRFTIVDLRLTSLVMTSLSPPLSSFLCQRPLVLPYVSIAVRLPTVGYVFLVWRKLPGTYVEISSHGYSGIAPTRGFARLCSVRRPGAGE